MPFYAQHIRTTGRIGESLGLRRAHIDPTTLQVTFVYYEWVRDRDWEYIERTKLLTKGTHYRVAPKSGRIKLLRDPFWRTKGRWTTVDCREPLLYKGIVKHPQYLDVQYENYKALDEDGDQEELDLVASERLGYNVRKRRRLPNADITGDEFDKIERTGPAGP